MSPPAMASCPPDHYYSETFSECRPCSLECDDTYGGPDSAGCRAFCPGYRPSFVQTTLTTTLPTTIPTTLPDTLDGTVQMAAIICAVVGALIVVVVICVALKCYFKKRNSSVIKIPSRDSESLMGSVCHTPTVETSKTTIVREEENPDACGVMVVK